MKKRFKDPLEKRFKLAFGKKVQRSFEKKGQSSSLWKKVPRSFEKKVQSSSLWKKVPRSFEKKVAICPAKDSEATSLTLKQAKLSRKTLKSWRGVKANWPLNSWLCGLKESFQPVASRSLPIWPLWKMRTLKSSSWLSLAILGKFQAMWQEMSLVFFSKGKPCALHTRWESLALTEQMQRWKMTAASSYHICYLQAWQGAIQQLLQSCSPLMGSSLSGRMPWEKAMTGLWGIPWKRGIGKRTSTLWPYMVMGWNMKQGTH